MTDSPRTSSVLEILYPDSMQYVQQEHLSRGSRQHKDMEDWGNAIILKTPVPEIYEECVPVAQLILDLGMTIVDCERQFISPLGFTGRPDVTVRWNGVMWVLDYKFSEAVTEQNEMQMEAYKRLTGYNGAFITCGKDGRVRLVKAKKRHDLWAAFLAGLAVKKFRLARGG